MSGKFAKILALLTVAATATAIATAEVTAPTAEVTFPPAETAAPTAETTFPVEEPTAPTAAPVAPSGAYGTPQLRGVEYKGFGVVEVSFAGACDWSNGAQIEIVDAQGNPVAYEVLGGDEDDCYLRIDTTLEAGSCSLRVSSSADSQQLDFDVVTGREYWLGADGQVGVYDDNDPCDICGQVGHDEDYCPQYWAGKDFVWREDLDDDDDHDDYDDYNDHYDDHDDYDDHYDDHDDYDNHDDYDDRYDDHDDYDDDDDDDRYERRDYDDDHDDHDDHDDDDDDDDD